MNGPLGSRIQAAENHQWLRRQTLLTGTLPRPHFGERGGSMAILGTIELEVPSTDKAYDSGLWFSGYTPQIYGQKYGTNVS